MGFDSWQAFYSSDLQQLYGLWIVPALCLFPLLLAFTRRRRQDGSDAIFVRSYCVWFCLETLLDPFATGPGVTRAGLSEATASLVMFGFVWLGDFRVLLLVFTLARPGGAAGATPLGRAAAWTCGVPILAGACYGALAWRIPDLPEQTLWMLYEFGFLALVMFVRRRMQGAGGAVSPERAHAIGMLRGATLYVAIYYGLWLLADLLIVVGGFDWGWGIRIVPNQLYYAFWVPFIYLRFFGAPSPSAPLVRAGSSRR